MTKTENIQDQTPKQIDATLADLLDQKFKAQHSESGAVRSLGYEVASNPQERRYLSYGEIVTRAKEQAAGDNEMKARRAQQGLDKVEAARQAVAEAEEAMAPYDAEFIRRGRWSRFFLVAGGHIHSSMNCSTCNNGQEPTRFGWLHELSGDTEQDAVNEHGALLCTTCFPSAPVEWTNFYEKEAEAKKAAQCPGSGTYYDDSLPHRKGYYTGNWATCPECGDTPTLTKSMKLRAHKPAK